MEILKISLSSEIESRVSWIDDESGEGSSFSLSVSGSKIASASVSFIPLPGLIGYGPGIFPKLSSPGFGGVPGILPTPLLSVD